jgi:hypothetical protein
MSDLRLSRLQKWVLQFLYTEAQGITMKQLWQGNDKEEIEDGRVRAKDRRQKKFLKPIVRARLTAFKRLSPNSQR